MNQFTFGQIIHILVRNITRYRNQRDLIVDVLAVFWDSPESADYVLDPAIYGQQKRQMLQMNLDADFLAKLLRYTMVFDKGQQEHQRPPVAEGGAMFAPPNQ